MPYIPPDPSELKAYATDLNADTAHLAAGDFAKIIGLRIGEALAAGDLVLPDGVSIRRRSDYALTVATVKVLVIGITWEQAHGTEGDRLADAIAPYCRGWAHPGHYVEIYGGPTFDNCTTGIRQISATSP